MKLKKYIYLALSLSLFSLSALAEPSAALLKKAEQGDLEAQLSVAGQYSGNDEKSVYWYEKAAQQGSIEAKQALYSYYKSKYDYPKQLEWLYSLMDDPKLSIDDEDYQDAITAIAYIYIRKVIRKER